ncbi:NAD(P)H dehydrogenase (quinone) [Ephemeroptericola cinctiostellae]|uniref:NAD(P)H dehydrogenase (Quinone) n=1 Tax=Ephemeroptericola cinctiostellae TaxID=2268024 RepID=A0A345DD07_9BURK|nr:NAD(P)H-dependent oxidoreductase [Ephemeroptericola cinctiostellae]AXF86245.1 NAD(P)H dehydrogenase (quinone) [Ephemeroptericola cinctiostellae]
MKTLLMVYHSQSGRTQSLIQAAYDGACASCAELMASSNAPHPSVDDDGTHIQVKLCHAREVEADVVRRADALLLATPENFGYMSGELKAMFDRTYDVVREDTAGRSYGLIVSCGNDGRGAQAAVGRIMVGYGMALAHDVLIVRGEVKNVDVAEAYALGQYMAAALAMGLI